MDLSISSIEFNHEAFPVDAPTIASRLIAPTAPVNENHSAIIRVVYPRSVIAPTVLVMRIIMWWSELCAIGELQLSSYSSNQ